MKEKEYLSLGGLFVALHLVFVLLSKFLPGVSLLLVIFLPLLSTIYTLKFKNKQVVMFIIATLFLCLVFDPISALIYVIPSLMCGVSYGLIRKKGAKELTLVYISSLAHSLSLLVSFAFIALLFKEVDFFSIFEVFINKEGVSFYACVYLVLMVLGVVEAFILHLVSDRELLKLGYKEVEKEKETPGWIILSLFISLISYLIFAFINPIYTCFCIPFIYAFLIPIVIEFVLNNKRKCLYILVAIICLGCIFLLNYVDVIFYPIIPLIVVAPLVMEKIVRVLYTFFLKCSNSEKNIIK